MKESAPARLQLRKLHTVTSPSWDYGNEAPRLSSECLAQGHTQYKANGPLSISKFAQTRVLLTFYLQMVYVLQFGNKGLRRQGHSLAFLLPQGPEC